MQKGASFELWSLMRRPLEFPHCCTVPLLFQNLANRPLRQHAGPHALSATRAEIMLHIKATRPPASMYKLIDERSLPSAFRPDTFFRSLVNKVSSHPELGSPLSVPSAAVA